MDVFKNNFLEGLDSNELGEIDGVDMWASLSHDLQSPRSEVFNNYDEIENYASLRVGPWKYVSGLFGILAIIDQIIFFLGTAQNGEVDDWYGESGDEDSPPIYEPSLVLKSETNIALSGLITDQQLQMYPHPGPQLLTQAEITQLRNSAKITCSVNRKGHINYDQTNSSYTQENQIIEEIANKLIRILESKPSNQPQLSRLDDFACDPRKTVCLFHLEQDPCEELNLAKFFPNVVKKLESRLNVLKTSVQKPLNQPGDPLSNPSLYNNTWTHWCDPENEYFPNTNQFNEKLSMLILDNILLKILTVPFVSVLAIVLQTIWSVIQTFISLITLILILVLAMFLANHVNLSNPKQSSRIR